MRIWEGTLRSRPEDALCRSSRATNDSESPLALEFYMVGTSKKSLKPSIVITCCSSSRKKAVKSFLGGLKWLKDSDLRYVIIVDKTFGHRASNALDNATTNSLLNIHARVPSEISSLCGVEAQVGKGDEATKFTLGGVILIDGRVYCMTVAHPFVAGTNKSASSTSSSDSINSDSDDSEFESSLDGNSQFDLEIDDVKPSSALSTSTTGSNIAHLGTPTPNKPGRNQHDDSRDPLRPFPHKGIIS
jgi:hypothetical protein